MKLPLTDRELEVLVFMKDFHRENDQLPPACTEIARRFGKQPTTAVYWAMQLEKKGWITKNAVGKYRFVRDEELAGLGARGGVQG